MTTALTHPLMTVNDYLAWEAEQAVKHDFFRGEVFAMTGGTLRHNKATLASAIAFKAHLKGQACEVFFGDVKVAVNVAQHMFYPDVVVTCNTNDLSDLNAAQISAPVLVLEVLSPSTAAYDRGQKFLSLQKLSSLQEYALLDVQAPRLEVHRRNAAGRFELYVFEGADCEAELASIGWRGPVAALID